MKKNNFFSLLICMCLNRLTAHVQYQVIGIYSMCLKSDGKSRNVLEARMHHRLLQYYFEGNIVFKTKQNSDVKNDLKNKLIYKYYDVCYNMTYLNKVVSDLLLDISSYSTTMDKTSTNTLRKSNIVYIYTFLSTKLQEQMDVLNSFSKIPIYMLNERPGNEQLRYSNYIGYDFQVLATLIEKFMSHYNWNTVTIVVLNNEKSSFQTLFEKFLNLYNANKTRCYDVQTIASTAFNNTYVDLIGRIERKNNILVLGDLKSTLRFVDLVSKSTVMTSSNKAWILMAASNDCIKMTMQLKQSNSSVNSNNYYFHHESPVVCIYTHDYTDDIEFQEELFQQVNFLQFQEDSINYFGKEYYNFGLLDRFLRSLWTSQKFDYLTSYGVSLQFIFIFYSSIVMFSGKELIGHYLQDSIDINVIPNLMNLSFSCERQLCAPGYESNLVFINNQKKKWDESSYQWTCQKCPQNLIQPHSKNITTKCQKCATDMLSNHERTQWYDPYKQMYLGNHKRERVILIAIITSIALVVECLMGIVFIRHSNTPIVRATDIKTTIIHFISSFLVLLCLPIAFIVKPSPLVCYGKCFIIAITFTLNASIVAMKSQNLLNVFNAKIRRTSTEVIKANLQSAFVIFIIVLGNCMLLVILFSQFPIKIQHRLNRKDMERIFYCNDGLHINAMIVYIMSIQLAALIQAFRARNLPETFNDSMPILYTMFVATVEFCITFPIHHFQMNELDKSMAHWIMLTLNNMIVLFFFYGKRIYVIMRKPHLNTTHNFQKESLDRIRELANKVI